MPHPEIETYPAPLRPEIEALETQFYDEFNNRG